jgi:hypothetical protein
MIWLCWISILLFVLPCIAGMTGTLYYTQPLVEMGGGLNFLPRLASNCDPPQFHLLSGQDYMLQLPCPAALIFKMGIV